MARSKFPSNSRRSFIEKITKGAIASSMAPGIIRAAELRENTEYLKREHFGPNDQIQLALIGAGGMGNADLSTSCTVPGVKLVAACDLYDGRLADINKKYGKDIFVTRDYKEILSPINISQSILFNQCQVTAIK